MPLTHALSWTPSASFTSVEFGKLRDVAVGDIDGLALGLALGLLGLADGLADGLTLGLILGLALGLGLLQATWLPLDSATAPPPAEQLASSHHAAAGHADT